jgi:hypothetical protein
MTATLEFEKTARSGGSHQTKQTFSPFPLDARDQCQDVCARFMAVAGENWTTATDDWAPWGPYEPHTTYSSLCSRFMTTIVMPVAAT